MSFLVLLLAVGFALAGSAAYALSPSPYFTTQPRDQAVSVGGTANFEINVSGLYTSYRGNEFRWEVATPDKPNNFKLLKNEVGLPVKIDITPDGVGVSVRDGGRHLELSKVTAEMNGWRIRCSVTTYYQEYNSYTDGYDYTDGSVTSNTVTLTVTGGGTPTPPSQEPTATPQITSQPRSQTAPPGSDAAFSVTATGNALTYQWQKSDNGGAWRDVTDGTYYSGAKTASLTVRNVYVSTDDGDKYRVVVSNATASLTSDAATLTVASSVTPTTPTVSTPSATPSGGSYTSAQSVSLFCATSGAAIHYTLDGSTPTSASATYSGTPISISSTTTLKAIATKSGSSNSSVLTAAYTITKESKESNPPDRDDSDSSGNSSGNSSGGGGCDAGFGAISLMVLAGAAVILRNKR
ncbi:hypothetical protein FACS1894167_07790 [Synergistales bacterium]|nr:hypothetical protein FACS1894167_07790 [Synergistales bacterium]